MFKARHLEAGYGPVQVLWDVHFEIEEGEFVGLLGPNGAGKTTTLRAVSGLIKVWSGEVEFKGRPIANLPAHAVNRMGISHVPQDLHLFPEMSVADNVLLGAYHVRDKQQIAESMDYVLHLFPVLKERWKQIAGTLSGGERKMLALARGLMSGPSLLLVDEPSLGLAPNLAVAVLEALQELRRRGTTILLVEQNVTQTLLITDRSYVLEHGRMVLEGSSQDLLETRHIKEAYLGLSSE